MEEMTIIKSGTKAMFGNIEGIVCGAEIVYTNVLYKFGYFDKDMNYKFIWAHEQELTITSSKKQKIGFLAT